MANKFSWSKIHTICNNKKRQYIQLIACLETNGGSYLRSHLPKKVKLRVGQSLFRSFALRSFALCKKSAKEQLALSLFSKRAICSFLKERKRAIHSFALLKRANCSFQKERFALFRKNAQKSELLLFTFFSFWTTNRSFFALFKEKI